MAYIAATELPQNLWPEVIPTLVANVTNMQATEALKESSLEALGYICEELVSVVCLASHRSDPAFLVKVVNHSCVTFYSFLMYVIHKIRSLFRLCGVDLGGACFNVNFKC